MFEGGGISADTAIKKKSEFCIVDITAVLV